MTGTPINISENIPDANKAMIIFNIPMMRKHFPENFWLFSKVISFFRLHLVLHKPIFAFFGIFLIVNAAIMCKKPEPMVMIFRKSK